MDQFHLSAENVDAEEELGLSRAQFSSERKIDVPFESGSFPTTNRSTDDSSDSGALFPLSLGGKILKIQTGIFLGGSLNALPVSVDSAARTKPIIARFGGALSRLILKDVPR